MPTSPPPPPSSDWASWAPLLHAVGDAVCGLDHNSRVVWLNRLAARVITSVGKEPTAVLGRSLFDLVPLGPDHELSAALVAARNTEVQQELVLTMRPTERVLRVRVVPLPIGVALVVAEQVDTAAITRAHAAYSARARTLFDAIPLPIIVHHRETQRVLAANRAASELCAVPLDGAQTIDGPTIDAVLTPQSEHTWTAQRADGTTFSAEVSAHDLDYDGHPARLLVLRDVTQQELAESERRLLREAVARLNDMVVITDARPNAAGAFPIVFVNEAFERHTGWHRDEVIGRSPEMLDGPRTDPATAERIRTALATGGASREEIVHYTRDGREYWVELEILPVYDPAGVHTHWVAMHRDITDRKRLEEQFFQSQKMEAVGRLAGGVAHDFNNLLTAIGGFSELLLEQLEPGTGPHDEVLQIRAASDRASALTRQLLAFSRKQIMRPQIVDLATLVRDMHRLIGRLVSADVAMRLNVPDSAPGVLADPVQLEQVLLNLVVNASEAMPTGGQLTIAVQEVTLSSEYVQPNEDLVPGRYVALQVTDTGIGMDRATRERAFEPFFTTKSGGTGLGLSTVYGIVRQSGGHVWVYSETGVGTTVKVYLPVSANAEPQTEPHLTTQAALGGHETILVVEDEPMVRGVARAMLERRGYTVLVAGDGDQAMRMASLHVGPIDLLLTDVVMPKANGRRVAEQLRVLRPGLRVLYMSGYTEDSIVHHGVLEPGIELLEKPFTEAALARRVRNALDNESSRR